MSTLNNEHVELLQEPVVEVETVPVEEKPVDELSAAEIKMIIEAKDKAIENYEATIKRLNEGHTKDIENMNEYYKNKIGEMSSVIKYYERKFKVLNDILNIEKGEDK